MEKIIGLGTLCEFKDVIAEFSNQTSECVNPYLKLRVAYRLACRLRVYGKSRKTASKAFKTAKGPRKTRRP